jgi:GNAT superfamily N-acetyltransferase
MLDEPARPELGIVAWSEWPHPAADTVRIEPYPGPRDALRELFEEAEDSAAQLDSYIGSGEVLVAMSGGAVVGHVQFLDDGADTEIKNMAVAASHRGRGIGRALIEAAVQLARSRGRSVVSVATAAADIGNLRFYQRAGFRMLRVDRDVFTPQNGYAGIVIDGIPLRDQVWLDREL